MMFLDHDRSSRARSRFARAGENSICNGWCANIVDLAVRENEFRL